LRQLLIILKPLNINYYMQIKHHLAETDLAIIEYVLMLQIIQLQQEHKIH
jgi:hypothetical protein